MTRFLAKTSAPLAALLATVPCQPAAAQEACTGPVSPHRLFVEVSNIRAAQGLIAITLYPDESRRFLARHGSLYVGRVPARAPGTRVCIHVPQPGTYAIAVYHDADANRRFNRSGIGLPAEGYGFSNDAPALFGLPAFRSVRFAVPRSDMTIRIRMRYP